MSNIKIAIFNLSTVLTDEQVQQAVPALQTQITRDFAPVWGVDGELVFIPHGTRPPQDMWWLGVFDDSDVAGALGYHDLTPEGCTRPARSSPTPTGPASAAAASGVVRRGTSGCSAPSKRAAVAVYLRRSHRVVSPVARLGSRQNW
jgi:hypothetical protein